LLLQKLLQMRNQLLLALMLQTAHFKAHQNVQWLLLLQKRNQLLQVMQRLAAQAKQKQSPLLQAMQIATHQVATKRKRLVAQWQMASK
jgi:hypothetical protein